MKRTTTRVIAIFAFALFVHMAILVHGIIIHSPNIDEIAHLPAGVAYWKFQTFEMYNVNPPLVGWLTCWPALLGGTEFDWSMRMQFRSFRPEFAIARRALTLYKLDYHSHFVVPRLIATLFSLIGCCAFCRTTWIVFGAVPSVVGCILWCVLPSFIAHAQTIGPDMAAVTTGILCAVSSFHYAKRPSFAGAIAVGICVGLAMLTKLTWITALVSVPCAVAAGRCVIEKSLLPLRSYTLWGDELMIFVVAITVLNTGYLFEGTFERLDERAFLSEALGGENKPRGETGNRFRGTLLGSLPLPVPKQYALGIDYLRYETEGKYWSFLNGEWRLGSWWYYYLATIAYKTPISLLVLSVGGLILTIGYRDPVQDAFLLCLGIPTVIAFVSISSQTGFGHHHRYAIFVYPLMLALVANGLRLVVASAWNLKRLSMAFIGLLVVTAVVEGLSPFPHFLGYFNIASGGCANGFKHLGYSNVDWGQDHLLVRGWLNEHTDQRPVFVDCGLPMFDVGLFGQETRSMPKDILREMGAVQSGWYIVSKNNLTGDPGSPNCSWLARFQPVGEISNSHFVYYLDEADVAQVIGQFTPLPGS